MSARPALPAPSERRSVWACAPDGARASVRNSFGDRGGCWGETSAQNQAVPPAKWPRKPRRAGSRAEGRTLGMFCLEEPGPAEVGVRGGSHILRTSHIWGSRLAGADGSPSPPGFNDSWCRKKWPSNDHSSSAGGADPAPAGAGGSAPSSHRPLPGSGSSPLPWKALNWELVAGSEQPWASPHVPCRGTDLQGRGGWYRYRLSQSNLPFGPGAGSPSRLEGRHRPALFGDIHPRVWWARMHPAGREGSLRGCKAMRWPLQ